MSPTTLKARVKINLSRASAGSDKTFLRTLNFVKLALNFTRPSRNLAVLLQQSLSLLQPSSIITLRPFMSTTFS